MSPSQLRRLVVTLTVSAVIFPIVLCVLEGVGALLRGMGDHLGGSVLDYAALAGGILWLINLICLILALAIASIGGHGDSEEP
jgi:hypothetical protein